VAEQVALIELGHKDYKSTWDYQEQLLQENVLIKQAKRNAEIDGNIYIGNETKHYFLYVEHPHVYTLGKSGEESNLLISAQQMQDQQIEYFKTNRGGDITYHGPGQIVGYPILDLEKIKADIVWYMRSLEEVIIKTCAHYGLNTERLAGSTGVWLDSNNASARKICAMGVRTSRWVTMHGFAFNINTDLKMFDHIIPCGINDKGVTSLAKELGHAVDMNEVKVVLNKNFEEVFGVKLEREV
jgi:lipoyl(octanoyl) transferase